MGTDGANYSNCWFLCKYCKRVFQLKAKLQRHKKARHWDVLMQDLAVKRTRRTGPKQASIKVKRRLAETRTTAKDLRTTLLGRTERNLFSPWSTTGITEHPYFIPNLLRSLSSSTNSQPSAFDDGRKSNAGAINDAPSPSNHCTEVGIGCTSKVLSSQDDLNRTRDGAAHREPHLSCEEQAVISESETSESESSLKCPHCSTQLPSLVSLGEHMKRNGPEPFLSCAACSLRFRFRCELSEHLASIHSAIPPPFSVPGTDTAAGSPPANGSTFSPPGFIPSAQTQSSLSVGTAPPGNETEENAALDLNSAPPLASKSAPQNGKSKDDDGPACLKKTESVQEYKCFICVDVFHYGNDLSVHLQLTHKIARSTADHITSKIPLRPSQDVTLDQSQGHTTVRQNGGAKQIAEETSRRPKRGHKSQKSGLKPRKQCEHCLKWFGNLREHERIHTGNLLECPFCPTKFTYQYSVLRHLRKHKLSLSHELTTNPSNSNSGRQEIGSKCGAPNPEITSGSITPEISLPTPLYGTRSTGRTPSNGNNLEDLNFKCRQCSQCFTSATDLVAHTRTHKGDQTNCLCHVCGLFHSRADALRAHIRIHEEEKHFECSICLLQFPRKRNVCEHLKALHNVPHEQTNSFVKDLGIHLTAEEAEGSSQTTENCECDGKSSENTTIGLEPSALEMSRHTRVHRTKGGVRVVQSQCKYCHRYFKVSYMPTHVRVHTGERPYRCSDCENVYKDVGTFRKHRKNVHGCSCDIIAGTANDCIRDCAGNCGSHSGGDVKKKRNQVEVFEMTTRLRAIRAAKDSQNLATIKNEPLDEADDVKPLHSWNNDYNGLLHGVDKCEQGEQDFESKFDYLDFKFESALKKLDEEN